MALLRGYSRSSGGQRADSPPGVRTTRPPGSGNPIEDDRFQAFPAFGAKRGRADSFQPGSARPWSSRAYGRGRSSLLIRWRAGRNAGLRRATGVLERLNCTCQLPAAYSAGHVEWEWPLSSWGGGAIPGAVGGTVGRRLARRRSASCAISSGNAERSACGAPPRVAGAWPDCPVYFIRLAWCSSHGLTHCFELSPARPRPSGDGGRWHRPHRQVHAVPSSC